MLLGEGCWWRQGRGRGLFCLVSSGGGDRAEPSGNDKSTTLLAPEGALNNWSPPPLAPDWGEEAEDTCIQTPPGRLREGAGWKDGSPGCMHSFPRANWLFLRENHWMSLLAAGFCWWWGETSQGGCVSPDGLWRVCGRPRFHPALVTWLLNESRGESKW